MKKNENVDKFISELNKESIDNIDIDLLDELGQKNMMDICKYILNDGDFQLRNNLTYFLYQSNLNLQEELR